MMEFANLLPTLILLVFCYALNAFYKKGFYQYPCAIFHIESIAEFQLLVLTFFLVFTGILWYANLTDHWNLLASLFSDLYQILIPRESPSWYKWLWAGYFTVLLTFTPIFTTRAALRRIYKKTPLKSLRIEKPGLWAYIKERRRLRKARKTQAQLVASPAVPRDIKVDLEKSSGDESVQTPLTNDVEESTQSIAEIREENSTIRRTLAQHAITFQWIYLVIIGCYLNNQLVWNAKMSDALGQYCDMISVALVYTYPLGWAMSFLGVYEAAVDHQEARALFKAAKEEDVHGASTEKTPLIIITQEADVQ